MVYTVGDGTGSIVAVKWLEPSNPSSLDSTINNGTHVRLVGRVKAWESKKQLTLLDICRPESQAEIDAHPLEVSYAKLKLREMKARLDNAVPPFE